MFKNKISQKNGGNLFKRINIYKTEIFGEKLSINIFYDFPCEATYTSSEREYEKSCVP